MSLVRIVSIFGLLIGVGGVCRPFAAGSDQPQRLSRTAPSRSTRAESRGTRADSKLRPVVHQEPAAQGHEFEAPPPDSVEELSLAQLVQEVQGIHPSVEAMSAAMQAARARYPQVTSLEDPMLSATLAPASLHSADVEPAYVLEASQKFPWHGKLTLRGAAASAEANSAAWDVQATRQRLAEVAELAFWEYSIAQRQLRLNEQNVAVLRSFRDSAQRRYETGLVTEQDVLQADFELANLEQRGIELERMDKVAAGRINVLLRRSPTATLPPPEESPESEMPLPDEELLLTRAVERRPDIASAAARVQAQQSKLSLACKEYYPDVEVFGRYDTFWQPSDTQGDLRGQIGARINLPIYHGRLNAAVSEATHQLQKARAEHRQLVLEAQSEVQSAYEQVRESQRSVDVFSKRLIPAAEQNVKVARSNYDVARITFLELAAAQRQLIEAREKQLQAEVELQRREATLRRYSGGALPGSSVEMFRPPSDSGSRPIPSHR